MHLKFPQCINKFQSFSAHGRKCEKSKLAIKNQKTNLILHRCIKIFRRRVFEIDFAFSNQKSSMSLLLLG